MTYSTKKRKYACEGERYRTNVFQPCQGTKDPVPLHWDQHKNISLPPRMQDLAQDPSLLESVSATCHVRSTRAQVRCPRRKLYAESLTELPTKAMLEMPALA